MVIAHCTLVDFVDIVIFNLISCPIIVTQSLIIVTQSLIIITRPKLSSIHFLSLKRLISLQLLIEIFQRLGI